MGEVLGGSDVKVEVEVEFEGGAGGDWERDGRRVLWAS